MATSTTFDGTILRGRDFESVEGRHLCHLEHARAVSDRLDGFLAEYCQPK